jgi:hypothetical protein
MLVGEEKKAAHFVAVWCTKDLVAFLNGDETGLPCDKLV